jgi:hypothetical protein
MKTVRILFDQSYPIPNVLQPANLVLPSLQVNEEKVRKFHVATACFSRITADLNLSNLKPWL